MRFTVHYVYKSSQHLQYYEVQAQSLNHGIVLKSLSGSSVRPLYMLISHSYTVTCQETR